MSFKGKIAIVTGPGRGIGRATAIQLAQAGAKVVLAGKSSNIEKVRDEIEAQGGEAFPVLTDIADTSSGERLARATMDKYGRIDLLVNNAAVHLCIGENKWPTVFETEVEYWDATLDINARGPFFLTKAIIPYMVEQNFGRIVFVSSVTGMHGQTASPAYNASKAALIVLTKTFATEFGKYNITVNTVAPGYVNTEMSGNHPQEVVDGWVRGIPLGRAAQPDDIARAILLFLQDETFINGQTVVCDGGVVLH